MRDLKDPKWMWLKGVLLLVIGLASAALLLFEVPSPKVALLLFVAIWGFCRAYYFAFYVIEHYVDGEYRFAGLGAFAAYLWRRRGTRRSGNHQTPSG